VVFQVDAKENEFGCEPLQWAARRGHLQLIRLLLNHGAKTSYQDKENRTAATWVPGPWVMIFVSICSWVLTDG